MPELPPQLQTWNFIVTYRRSLATLDDQVADLKERERVCRRWLQTGSAPPDYAPATSGEITEMLGKLSALRQELEARAEEYLARLETLFEVTEIFDYGLPSSREPGGIM